MGVGDKNEPIKDALRYYLQAEKTHHAVLLTGAWGCGKTHFIQDFMDKWAENPEDKADKSGKYFYISLYGLHSLEDLKQQLAILAYPNIAKIKNFINIGFSAARLNISLSEEDLGKFAEKIFNNLKHCVLIFDDLERCSIPIAELFGFINALVESQGIKTICIANEDKIGEKEKDVAEKYKEIKEKLIGQTLEVQSDPAVVLDSFIDEMAAGKAKNCVRDNKEEALRVFARLNIRNYRSLRVALYDYARLLSEIEKIAPFFTDEGTENSRAAMKQLLILVLVADIQYRAGALNLEFLLSPVKYEKSIAGILLAIDRSREDSRTAEKKENDKKADDEAVKRDGAWDKLNSYFANEHKNNPIISYKVLFVFLQKSHFDADAAAAHIKAHYLFEDLFPKELAKQSVWPDLQYGLYWMLDEQKFTLLTEKFKTELEHQEITSIKTIFEIVGNLILWEKDFGRSLDFIKPTIGDYFHNYLLRLGEKIFVQVEDGKHWDFIAEIQADTLGIKKDNADLKKVRAALSNLRENKYKADAEQLLLDFKDYKNINSYGISEKYGSQPIVSFWNVKDITDTIFAYKGSIHGFSLYNFLHSYRSHGIGGIEPEQKTWFDSLKREMEMRAEQVTPEFQPTARHIVNYLFGIKD